MREGERTFRLNTAARVSVTVLLDGYVSIGGMCHISMEDFLAMGKVANALAKEQRR
jgi:hypothetical protein